MALHQAKKKSRFASPKRRTTEHGLKTLTREIGRDEMHRMRKRYAAFFDALKLQSLRRRMIYFKDFNVFRKGWAAKRKAVKASASAFPFPLPPSMHLRCSVTESRQ